MNLLLGVVIGVLGALLLGCMHHSHAAKHFRINDSHHRHLHHMKMSDCFGEMDHMRHMAPMKHRMDEMMERMTHSEQRTHRDSHNRADAGDVGGEAEYAASLPSED
jgi:hypothetical protein